MKNKSKNIADKLKVDLSKAVSEDAKKALQRKIELIEKVKGIQK